ncbi:MAG: hypothetical protein EOM61_07860 [Bacteroidia bacterium]|nr:hypothetical protein [Bacteroidia bacterium]
MHKLQPASPVLEVLQSFFLGIHFIENFLPGAVHFCSGAGFEELERLRISGDCSPVLIIGLDPLETLPAEHRNLLSMERRQAAFYRQLPCSREELEKAVDLVRKSPAATPPTREEIIREVRAYKHRCDNVCMARSACTSKVQKMLPDSPGSAMAMLREFALNRLEKLQLEYEALSNAIASLAIPGAETISDMFMEMRLLVAKMSSPEITLDQAIELSFACIQKLRNISNILDAAKVKE